jgi:1,4-alpha-glucan branching enzyme
MSLQKQFLKSKKVYKVTFSLPVEAASAAKAVLLVGDFNNWDKNEGILMSPKKGAYSATVELEPGKEYQFRYLVDGETWENDWEADKYITTPFGIDNSVVVVPPQEGA